MIYEIRYTPEAQRDMDEVWEGVLEASGERDIAVRYVEDFLDKIAEKKVFPKSGIPLYYRGLFTGFYSVNFKAYKAFYDSVSGKLNVHFHKVKGHSGDRYNDEADALAKAQLGI